MSERQMSRSILLLFGIASIVIVIAGMKAAKDIIVPFLLSGFIAIICGPLLLWLKKRGLSDTASIVMVLMVVTVIGLLIAALVGNSVNDFAGNVEFYQTKFDALSAELAAGLSNLGITIEKKAFTEYINFGAVMSFAAELFTGFGNVLSNAFIIILTVIFILLESSGFRDKLETAFNRPDLSMAGFDNFIKSINKYMAIKTWISLATGVFVAVLLALLGVDYPFLWGMLAFLLNYIPNIGSIIAAVPPTLLALVQFGLFKALLVVAGFTLVNVIIGNVLEPRFLGKGLGLSTLVVFFSLVFWGWVLGPVGMFLSVPLTMTIKIALASSEDTNWISVLMDHRV